MGVKHCRLPIDICKEAAQTRVVYQKFADKVERGISPTVREGSVSYAAKPMSPPSRSG